LEDRELAPRLAVVHALGHRADELRLDVPRRRRDRRSRQRPRPPEGKVLRHVGDDGAFETEAGVVPADAVAPWVIARVETVAAEGREVEAADVRDTVVDEDKLLVVAMHRPLARVELHLDAGPGRERVADRPD